MNSLCLAYGTEVTVVKVARSGSVQSKCSSQFSIFKGPGSASYATKGLTLATPVNCEIDGGAVVQNANMRIIQYSSVPDMLVPLCLPLCGRT